MKKNSKNSINVILLVVLLALACISLWEEKYNGPYTKYECDVKNLRLSTTINITKNDEEFVKVKGNILKFVTDPLTMYDLNENRIAYAGDAYHFIAQDSHAIYVNENETVEMVGLVDLFGESYKIYDESQQKIAELSFNMSNTKGRMYDAENNLIADYTSNLFFNDFNVRILEKCNLDEKTVLMIFCSYYSDQHADHK